MAILEDAGRQGLPEREAVEGDAHTGSWLRSRLRGGKGYVNTSTQKGRDMRPFCVEVSGLEPKLAEPKSVVLPLHHTSIPNYKYRNFFNCQQISQNFRPKNLKSKAQSVVITVRSNIITNINTTTIRE